MLVGPIEQVRARFPSDWKWETVDIDEYRSLSCNEKAKDASHEPEERPPKSVCS